MMDGVCTASHFLPELRWLGLVFFTTSRFDFAYRRLVIDRSALQELVANSSRASRSRLYVPATK